jgi:hypothetical protein
MEWSNIWGGISGITILYALIASLLCWFIIGVKGRWIIKTLIIALSVWFAITLAYTFNNFMGWPSEEDFKTQTSQIIWFQIKEPSKVRNTEGAIYLWIREINPPEKPRSLTIKELFNPMHWFVYPDPNTAPRAYKIDYTKEMHKKLREVAEGRGEGKVAFLKTEGQKLGDGKKKNRADQEKDDGINIEIIAPDMIIPKKP